MTKYLTPPNRKKNLLWIGATKRKRLRGGGLVLAAMAISLGAPLLVAQDSATETAPPNTPQTQVAIAPAANTPGSLEVYPPAVDLNTRADYQSLVVRIRRADGVTLDLTHVASYRIEHPEIAEVSGNMIRPKADGHTAIIIEHDGQTTRVPLTVSDAQGERAISFRLDVMPIFGKTGCNNGSCHGSSRGQDGFHLSIFGFDPATDHFNITRQLPGRRINLADIERSLLLTKAAGQVPHTGGQLFAVDHPFYATLKSWLDAGAPDDPADQIVPVSVEIYPQDIVLEGEGAGQRLTVLAHYSDGSDRDVTEMSVLITSNEPSVALGEDAAIIAGQRGEAFVMARFEAFTVGTPVIVLPLADPSREPYPQTLEANNYVDERINDKLRRMRIVPSGLCSDEIYLRRVYIDIVGQLPPPEERDAFVVSDDPNKRAAVVDELLERKAFVEMWVMKWAERLQIRSGNQTISPKSAVLYYEWLAAQLAENRPMNQIVHDIIASEGGTFASPATNFYQIERDTLKLAENTVQVFIGARMQCAQCHNHPFDRWTMDDYYGFAAFFAQIGRKGGEDPREQIIFNRNNGEVNHIVGNRPVAPRYLGAQGPVELERNQDRRVAMADWLTSPDNDAFNRNLANIVWEQFMGRGITHPVDDVRVSNPPVNAPLLDALADRLVETDYDFKQLVRDICASRAYQRTTQVNDTNAGDGTNFSHAQVRRIRAEVLLDCISQVTGTRDKFRGLPMGARAVQIVDGNTSTYFLTTFGRARRDTVCTCEVIMEPNLSQALHLINGSATNDKIRQGNVVRRLLEEGKAPQEVIDTLYRTCTSRAPTDSEMQTLMGYVVGAEDQRQALEDVFWALLNSKEFMFNH